MLCDKETLISNKELLKNLKNDYYNEVKSKLDDFRKTLVSNFDPYEKANEYKSILDLINIYNIDLADKAKNLYEPIIDYLKNFLPDKTYTTVGRKKDVAVTAKWITEITNYFSQYKIDPYVGYIRSDIEKQKKRLDEEKFLKTKREQEELDSKLKTALISFLNNRKPNNLYSFISLEDLKVIASESLKESNNNEKFELNYQCDYCSSYTLGNRRCDCGNRRINAYYTFLLNENDELKYFINLEAY